MMALGALASLAITHWYNLKALRDMRAEVNERRGVDESVFRGIESVGSIKYSRDTIGRDIGVAVELHGQASADANATGALSATLAARAKK